MFRHLPAVLIAALFLCGSSVPLGAQEPVPPEPSAMQEAELFREVSPGRAFLRAILVPGWGHASIGEHTRGGFYFLAETVSAWMVVRTRTRLNAAEDVRDQRVAELEARLRAEGVTDPEEIARVRGSDPGVIAAESLVEARSQQFEDWLVLGIFFVFLGGADAFVSAHLRDFPEPVGLDFDLTPEMLELGVSLPLGRREPPR